MKILKVNEPLTYTVDSLSFEETFRMIQEEVNIGVECLRRINAKHPELLDYLQRGETDKADLLILKTIFEEGIE